MEQDTNTELTKRIQGTDHTLSELQKRVPSSEKVAALLISAVDKGDFIICNDSWNSFFLFTNMIGSSPKRGLGIVDSVVGAMIGWIVLPTLRRKWDRMCREAKPFRRENA
jgi:3-dehydrosphinganine reductase